MIAMRCEAITKSFENPHVDVLKNINLEIEKGDFVSITGRSGSGKSTLLYVMSGLDVPTTGQMYVLDNNLNTISEKEQYQIRNTKIGFIFQFHYLLPELTALENILMPARKLKKEAEKKEMALKLLDIFGLQHCAHKLPSQMSGGEQQRIAIGRALIMGPEILFADEPTGNLDSKNGEMIMDIFSELNAKQNTTIVLVTHEPDFAKMTKRQIFLKDGSVIKDSVQKQKKTAKTL